LCGQTVTVVTLPTDKEQLQLSS